MNTSGRPPVYLTAVHAAAYLTPSESASSECRRRPTTSCIGRCTSNTLRPAQPPARRHLSHVIRIMMLSVLGVGIIECVLALSERRRARGCVRARCGSDINSVPLNGIGFNKHRPSRARARVRASIHCRRAPSEACRPSASGNPWRGAFSSVLPFCGNFYGAERAWGIAEPPRKMDHESVTIHFPLGNYVIKMISGNGVMDDPPMNVTPPRRRFLEYARNVP